MNLRRSDWGENPCVLDSHFIRGICKTNANRIYKQLLGNVWTFRGTPGTYVRKKELVNECLSKFLNEFMPLISLRKVI